MVIALVGVVIALLQLNQDRGNTSPKINNSDSFTGKILKSLSTYSKIDIKNIEQTGKIIDIGELTYDDGVNFKLYESNKSIGVIHYVLVPDEMNDDNYNISKQMTVLLNVLLNNVKDNYYLTKCKNYLNSINIEEFKKQYRETLNNMINKTMIWNKIDVEDVDVKEINNLLSNIDWLNNNVINKVTKCEDKGVKYLKKFYNRVNLYAKSIQ